MKAIIKMAFAVAPILFMSCDDDVKQPAATPAGDGDDVQFTVPSALESRTMYSDDWDPETKKQDIFWGNYMAAKKDSIKIFCKNTVNNTVAVYQVEHGTNSNTAVDITKTGDKAMQWGGKEQTYNFYAFYPARQAGDGFLNGTDNTIRATVATGQSPTSYRAEIGGKNGNVVTSLQDVLDNSTASVANRTVIYGQPDMSAAIMYAKTSTEAKEGYALAEYGQPVPLNFNVLADVIDITINGPVTPNQLSGNASDPSLPAINVQTVTLEAVKDGVDQDGKPTIVRDDSKIISGSFDLNMETATISNVSGNATVQLQTSQEGSDKMPIFPTLYARATVAADQKPELNQLDQLRFRAFIIPGSIKNLSELQVRVMTNCGEYVQRLGDDALNSVSGKIYPVKLGYFHYRGLQFDLERWIGQLNPNIYISELSIPGAWHAANAAYQGSVTMEEMYKAGIRAFEVHTTNGTVPQAYNSLGTAFNAETAEYFPEHLNEKIDPSGLTINQTGNLIEGTSNIVETSNGVIIPTYTQTETQNVTAQFTASGSAVRTYQQKPKFSLRLYRTQNVSNDTPNPTASLSDAIKELAKIMNPDGLMFLELGMDSQRQVQVGCKTVSQNLTTTGGLVTRSGTRTRTRTKRGSYGNYGNWSDWSTVTWQDIPTDSFEWTVVGTPTSSYDSQMTIEGGEAWAIAVQTCLNRLKTETNPNPNINVPVVYPYEITANTTIQNVKGSVIVKINTNAPDDGDNEKGWEGNQIPALFSQWIKNDASEPLTINLQWGSPVAPQASGTEPTTSLRWCFSELDNIGSTTENREKAIVAMNAIAAANYAGGLHRTFYETSLGGFLNGSVSEENCLAVANALNPYAYNRIVSPSRNACPLGLVFMNYVIPPTGNTTMKSEELIRAIINNNAAFLLNRADGSGGTTTRNDVKENTNSSFVNDNDGLSPLR